MQKLVLKTIILFISLFIADKSYSQLNVTYTWQNNSCHGTSDGSASVHASGGTLPYTYLWNPSGQTQQTATSLSAGNYTVTVTDAIGATTTATIAITEPAIITASISITSTTCNGNTGTATIHANGGTSPFTYLWNTSPPQSSQTVTGLASGSYSVMATDAHGCISTMSISITTAPSPSISLTLVKDAANPLLWYGHDSIIGGTAPFTYLWNFGDGDTSTLAYPTHTYSVSGHYAICLTVTDANGCSGSTCDSTYKLFSSGMIKYLDILKSLNAGIENLQNTNAFSIYPNPTNGSFNLQMSKLENVQIKIYDVIGECIYQHIGTSANLQIDLSNQSNGVYFLNVKSELEESDKKIIISK